jgi:hypothetical protein
LDEDSEGVELHGAQLSGAVNPVIPAAAHSMFEVAAMVATVFLGVAIVVIVRAIVQGMPALEAVFWLALIFFVPVLGAGALIAVSAIRSRRKTAPSPTPA